MKLEFDINESHAGNVYDVASERNTWTFTFGAEKVFYVNHTLGALWREVSYYAARKALVNHLRLGHTVTKRPT